MSARKIRLLVVDDHELVRAMLSERLAQEPDMEVVSTATSAGEAIRTARESRPDVILMDVDMPGLICFEAAGRIAAMLPETSVIYLSAYCSDYLVAEALQANAAGYLTKSEPPETLIEAVRQVASGSAYFSPEIRARIVVGKSGPELTRPVGSRAKRLTSRERQILQYLARGLAKKQIASLLSIAVKTVDRHTFNLMEKLGIHDRVGLARFAVREGFTTS